MNTRINVNEELIAYLKKNARAKGYYFNKNSVFVNELLKNLCVNLKRYGYASCPRRLSTSVYGLDSYLICPCRYMENDIKKYGSGFCALYVSKDAYEGKKETSPIPESRPKDKLFGIDYSNPSAKKLPIKNGNARYADMSV